MAESDLQGPMILVVEDNAINALLVREALERSNFRIVQAKSAQIAKDLLQTLQPDLILMDIQLPGQDGLSFTRELKADTATAHIPVVALTSRAMPEDERAASEAGCDAYMTKPVNIHTIGRALTAIIDRVRAD